MTVLSKSDSSSGRGIHPLPKPFIKPVAPKGFKLAIAIRYACTLFWEFKRRVVGKKFIAEFDVTDKCNLRCNHCYHFAGKNSFSTKKLDITVWRSRLTQLYELGVRMVVVVGGEPALRNDVIDLAAEIFPYVDVITNGTLPLSDRKNVHPIVSLDGNLDSNDAIRGNGVFNKALSSSRNFATLNMTLTESNYLELEEVIQLAIVNGFAGVMCNLYTPTAIDNTNSNVFHISNEPRRKILDHLETLRNVYPGFLMFSDNALAWYRNPFKDGYCYWSSQVYHFDVNWKPRKCFSDSFDCENCGCYAGAAHSTLDRIPMRAR